jgi:excisionase family DNA binding protein
MSTDPILVPIKVATDILGQGRTTIYELIAAEKIRAVKSGRSTLIVYESLKQYAASLPSAKIIYGRGKRGADAAAAS